VADPIAYFITFSCYGKRLPGNEVGYVDRRHNAPWTPLPSPDRARLHTAQRNMTGPSRTLDAVSRAAVLEAITEVCRHRSWRLFAAHVRTDHVHVVVQTNGPPSVALHSLKAYATRRLNAIERSASPRWAAHGSTRYLWTEEAVHLTIEYVTNEQGTPMALYAEPSLLAEPCQ